MDIHQLCINNLISDAFMFVPTWLLAKVTMHMHWLTDVFVCMINMWCLIPRSYCATTVLPISMVEMLKAKKSNENYFITRMFASNNFTQIWFFIHSNLSACKHELIMPIGWESSSHMPVSALNHAKIKINAITLR